MARRLLFASIHSYLDPCSGAALATRELLELLAARGWDCRALTCGVLDYQTETPLEDVLAAIDRPTPRVGAGLRLGGEAEVFDLQLEGVRVTLLPTAFSRAERAPGSREPAIFLDLAEQVLDRFRPEVLLTYGGHPASRELMHRLLSVVSCQWSVGKFLRRSRGRQPDSRAISFATDNAQLTTDTRARMANTPDPRDFYGVSRVVLMPSLWRESLGRVPIEAMANGIPVLASDRGALPETLGDAGFVFTIPERCTPASGVVPTAHEVAPWVAVIERLWDEPAFEVEHRRRALAEAQRWDGNRLANQYEKFFVSLATS